MILRRPIPRRKLVPVWAILLLLDTAPLSQSAPPSVPTPQTQQLSNGVLPATTPALVTTTLPYTTGNGGTQVIRVTLGGTVTADFLFDTGTNISCISQALVTRLGLTPHPAIGIDGLHLKVGGKPAQAADVDFRFGDFIAHQTPLVIFNEGAWESVAGRHLDGVLGANILTVFPALLDVPGKQIIFLSRSPSSSEDMAQVAMGGAGVVAVRDQKSDFLFRCPVRFRNGDKEAEASLLVDSGAGRTSLPAETARKLGLKPAAESTYETAFGSFHNQTAAAGLVSIGGINPPRPLSMLVDWTNDRYPASFGGAGLGLDVLSRYRVLFDFRAKKMYLSPLAPPAR